VNKLFSTFTGLPQEALALKLLRYITGPQQIDRAAKQFFQFNLQTAKVKQSDIGQCIHQQINHCRFGRLYA